MYDVQISGRFGFYTISPSTETGRTWLNHHASNGERTYDAAGNLLCDDVNACRTIVRAMDRAGLVVSVNGVNMKGLGAR